MKPLKDAYRFAESIPLVWALGEGSYTSVDVFYNEILCCNVTNLHRIGGRCNCTIADPARFDPDGVVDMRIFAWNSLSNETVNMKIEVLKDIQNPLISMLTSNSPFGSGEKGLGSLQNLFPAEYPLVFNVSYEGGPAHLVEWKFNCDVTGLTKEFEFKFQKSFLSTANQQCDIKVTLQNNLSTVNANGSVVLKQSVLLTDISNDGPLKLNQTITLTISFVKFAPETCMWVDLGDNSSLRVYGDASCASKFLVADINPNIVQETPQFYQKDSSTSIIVIEHKYPREGSFFVKINASNAVSVMVEETVVVILALECHNPNITITGKLFSIAFVL